VWADASLLLVAFRISIALGSSSRATGAGAFGGDVFFFAAGGAVCFGVADGDVPWAASVPAAAKSTASTISANEQVLSERIIVHLGLTLDPNSRQILMESLRNQTAVCDWRRHFVEKGGLHLRISPQDADEFLLFG
jgi:hypothetical protein